MALLARPQAHRRILQLGDPVLQRLGHQVEVVGDHRQLVLATRLDAVREEAVGDRTTALQQQAQVAGEQIAERGEQDEGEQDLRDRDRQALLHDRLAGRGEYRDRDSELQHADLVARQQQLPAHMHEVVGEQGLEETVALFVRLRHLLQPGHAGAHQQMTARVADAHIEQAFVGVGKKLAEHVLEPVEPALLAVGGGHRVQHARGLTDRRLQARRHCVVHQPHAVREQHAQQHHLHHRTREQQADADRRGAEGERARRCFGRHANLSAGRACAPRTRLRCCRWQRSSPGWLPGGPGRTDN
jgi:hypothetical protein